MTKERVIQNIKSNLLKLVNLIYPWLKDIVNQWPQMIYYLEQYRPLIWS